MSKEFFKDWNPKPETMQTIITAIDIIETYQEDGYKLTLRQLYYQFVARDLIENSERSYKNLGTVITKARDAGYIDWNAIEDRNREFNSPYLKTEQELLDNLPKYVSLDKWANQDYRIEVWVEKEALGNVVARTCDKWQVPHMACKGYLSASEAYRAGKRVEREYQRNNKTTMIIHLGDHDPSGIDMSRDNESRVKLYSNDTDFIFRRIALNMEQVDEFDPPPNPAKITDSRAKEYIKRFGRTSWELDALEPRVIDDLISESIKSVVDLSEFSLVEDKERDSYELLTKLSRNWPDIKKGL